MTTDGATCVLFRFFEFSDILITLSLNDSLQPIVTTTDAEELNAGGDDATVAVGPPALKKTMKR